MFKVQSRIEFDAAHFLLDSKTPCDVLHGHRWAVDVILKSDSLTKDGFVVNFVILKGWMKEMVENLDHNLVNYYLRQPTAENLTCLFFIFINDKLKDYNRKNKVKVLVDEIRIAETPNNIATFSVKDLNTRAEKIRRHTIEQWANPDIRKKMQDGINEANKDPVVRKLRSIRMLKNNPMSKREVVQKMLESLMKSKKILPNNGELMLIDFFKKNDINLSFCGNGSFIIGGKIPDFVNHDKKVVVEYNGRFWHSKNEWNDAYDDSKERIEHFAKYGYKCYIIWDDEFKKFQQRILQELKGLLK